MKSRRALILLLIGLVVASARPAATLMAESVSARTQNNVKIGGSVYSFSLEGDGHYHLRGYACNKKGTSADQGNHPTVEVYLDAPVTYNLDGDRLPGSGVLQKTGPADQAGATRDEANACDYVHEDSPAESFWRNMRFDLSFGKAELAGLTGRKFYVSGAWHAPDGYVPRVQEGQLANSPITVSRSAHGVLLWSAGGSGRGYSGHLDCKSPGGYRALCVRLA